MYAGVPRPPPHAPRTMYASVPRPPVRSNTWSAEDPPLPRSKQPLLQPLPLSLPLPFPLPLPLPPPSSPWLGDRLGLLPGLRRVTRGGMTGVLLRAQAEVAESLAVLSPPESLAAVSPVPWGGLWLRAPHAPAAVAYHWTGVLATGWENASAGCRVQ